MLLQRLKEYQSRPSTVAGEDTELPPAYKRTPIPWVIQLNIDGEQPQFIRTSGGTSQRDTGMRLAAPLLRRSGTRIKPQLLADTAEFVLGKHNPKDPGRAAGRHEEFVVLVEACATHTGDERVGAVAKFLRDLPTRRLRGLPSDLQPQNNVTFEVEGIRPIALESVSRFWARIAPRLAQRGLPILTKPLILSWLDEPEAATVGQCLVCGEVKPIERVHPVPIRVPRPVSDQQLSIVTANKEAFWSYGLEQSYVAPACRECAEAYGRAINRLAQDPGSHLLVGSLVFIFWTREEVAFNFGTLISDPQPEQVRDLIGSVRTGKRLPKVDETPFYATALSGSGGRAVVREWLDTTVGEVQRHAATWFQRQAIVGPGGEEGLPLGLYALALGTVREARDLPTPTPRALLRSALTGTPLPWDMLYQAVRRNRAEQRVTRPRAVLAKLVLLSHQRSHKEEDMVQLDPDNPSAAYRCGRLMAVLEQAQSAAIPGVSASVVDRFYGTASSAPASVFSRLLQGVQPHLSKLQRDRPGAYHAIQRRLEDILSGVSGDKGFPRTLTLEEQGLFSLGYYHQRAHDRAQARQAVERRASGDTGGAKNETHDEEEG